MKRARLWSYLAWQARDFAFERGAPLLIVATLMAFPVIMELRKLRPAIAMAGQAQSLVVSGVLEVLSQFSFIAVLIGINGIVSNDRVRGYYRFLFAKPVSIPRYYAQAFVVNGAGLAFAALTVMMAIYAFGYPVFLPRALLMVGLAYVSLGGLGFLFSTVARFDWVLMGGTWGLAQVLRAVYPAPQSRAGRVLDVILPPYHRLRDVSLELAGGDPTDTTTLAWLLGWGVTAFILGLIILRRRPLAT